MLERALAEELTDHLGYESGDPAGAGVGQQPHRYSSKRGLTEAGRIDPSRRTRPRAHEPRIVRKGQRRLDGIDKIVLGLYAHGVSTRDIGATWANLRHQLCSDLISRITDAVLCEAQEWQSRPLDRVWPVIFLDAIVCKVRDSGTAKKQGRSPGGRCRCRRQEGSPGPWVAHQGRKLLAASGE
ncbi:MAG: transposase [Nocardioidaceae bacterium]|nr:transposase [Nocardioidaceae bacterium]